MLKNLSALVFEVEGKIFHLLAESDSPLDHVIQVGEKIIQYCQEAKVVAEQVKKQLSEQQASEASVPQHDEPKVDDGIHN